MSAELDALQHRADDLILPDDRSGLVAAWMEHAESLPKEEPKRRAIINNLIHARNMLEKGDDPAFRVAIYLVKEYFKDAQFNGWLGGIRRQYGKDAEHRRNQVEEERGPVWALWQAEADKIRAESTVNNLSKSEIARRIKKRLRCDDPEGTIRKRIT